MLHKFFSKKDIKRSIRQMAHCSYFEGSNHYEMINDEAKNQIMRLGVYTMWEEGMLNLRSKLAKAC